MGELGASFPFERRAFGAGAPSPPAPPLLPKPFHRVQYRPRGRVQAQGHLGCADGFLTVLMASGTSFVYSTLLGGSASDSAAGVAVDGSGNAYVAGTTTSSDFLAAPLPPRPPRDTEAIYVVKLLPGGGFDQRYAYDELGNLTLKGGTSSSYGANGNGTGAGPHQARSVGGQVYSYDAAGNLLSGGGRSYTWNAESRLTQVVQGGLTETYGYDGHGERVKRVAGGVTTISLEGLWEERLGAGGVVHTRYSFGGQVVAVRDSSAATVTYLMGDHLGSISVGSISYGFPRNDLVTQDFDPWGAVRLGLVAQISQNFTGQQLDATGLLYYHARYYDPALGRFLSADTVVPGSSPLTVWPSDTVASGMWRTSGNGPANPQELNRYSYALNNPLRYTDPTGHVILTIGITIRTGIYYGSSISFGLAFSDDGSVGVYGTSGQGPLFIGGLGAGVGVSIYPELTNVNSLAGPGVQIGADIGPVSGDLLAAAGGKPIGGSGGVGVGPLLDVHGERTNTGVVELEPV